MESATNNYEEDRLNLYTPEEIGNMPHWIEESKDAAVTEIDETPGAKIDISRMNDNQRLVFNIVRNHYQSESDEQLLMIITGLGSSGKSFVIGALRTLLDEKCKECAFFGIAAFNIKGTSLR